MTSEKVIERLKAKNWYVKCENEHEQALLLNACLDAEVAWTSGKTATCFNIDTRELTVFIGREEMHENHHGKRGLCLGIDVIFKEYNCEDITDWFFNEINK